MNTLTIQPLQTHQIHEAKLVICTVVHEIFKSPPTPQQAKALLQRYEEKHELADVTEFDRHYTSNDGLFLVLLFNDRVVGTGAIRKIDKDTAELKRMWFLPEYRGLGYGRIMATQLLCFAQSRGYKRVRLDTDRRQHQAAKLYERLGFIDIDRYNDSVCDRFMELKF